MFRICSISKITLSADSSKSQLNKKSKYLLRGRLKGNRKRLFDFNTLFELISDKSSMSSFLNFIKLFHARRKSIMFDKLN